MLMLFVRNKHFSSTGATILEKSKEHGAVSTTEKCYFKYFEFLHSAVLDVLDVKRDHQLEF